MKGSAPVNSAELTSLTLDHFNKNFAKIASVLTETITSSNTEDLSGQSIIEETLSKNIARYPFYNIDVNKILQSMKSETSEDSYDISNLVLCLKRLFLQKNLQKCVINVS